MDAFFMEIKFIETGFVEVFFIKLDGVDNALCSGALYNRTLSEVITDDSGITSSFQDSNKICDNCEITSF